MGCSRNKRRGSDLLEAADDNALIFLNDGTPTHMSFSYGTSEASDISLVSPDLHPLCKWTVLKNIGSDYLPMLINIRGCKFYSETHRYYWNFKKANWVLFEHLTETEFGNPYPWR